MKRRFNERKVAMFILIAAVAITVFSFIVMSLWNVILSPVLHISTITFVQALGILVLSKILFGGFRGGGWHHRRQYWKQNMEAKMANMTPEEREKFKQEWKNRCSHWGRSYHEEQTPAQQTNTSAE
ncbi:MAG: hypothetical protein M3O67_09765 [Bacteroidota bacterium]|nr:hypothetical protein [Bacteroidota bacterium]